MGKFFIDKFRTIYNNILKNMGIFLHNYYNNEFRKLKKVQYFQEL